MSIWQVSNTYLSEVGKQALRYYNLILGHLDDLKPYILYRNRDNDGPFISRLSSRPDYRLRYLSS